MAKSPHHLPICRWWRVTLAHVRDITAMRGCATVAHGDRSVTRAGLVGE
jgi:hypothetical protein